MGTLKKLILSLITSFTVILSTPFFAQASPLAYPIERISGQDRVETALDISQKGWNSAQTVILSEYSDYADSIAATPFAVSVNAPILLTAGDSIDPRVVEELKRLKPQKVILLGGTGCLKSSIEKDLDQLAIKWERMGGADRYETSILLAKSVHSDSLILANGDNFPDALSAASFAGIKQIPIVLTSDTLPNSVIEYYKETHPQHLIVIGGEGVIPSNQLIQNNLKIETRLGGQDRYETNAKVVTFMKDAYTSEDLFLASGLTFPDAVAGTVLASKLKAPLLLTETEDIPPSVYSLMREHMQIEPPAQNPSNSSDTKDNSNSQAKKGKITAAGGLNLRDNPSSTGKMLLTIPAGTMIDLANQQGQWYQTTYNSVTGWVSADYVTVTTTNPIQKGKITASGGLNLRDNPSSTGKMLLTIPVDTTVDLVDQQNQWYKTTYQAKTGWISAQYVTIVSSNPANSDTSNDTTTPAIDLSVNGTVHILGGPGVVSTHTQNIIEGKASSTYTSNLKAFPSLPSEIKKPEPPSRGGGTPPVPTTYDPSKEVLVDPFKGFPANALTGKTILVDPGHGGPDTGAVGPNHTYEKNNTLAMSLALRDILKQAGATVILTRDKDVSPAANYSEIADLQARVDLANKTKADLFICIHNDSFSNADIQGTSTFYSSDNLKSEESLQLASSIQSAVIDTVKSSNRGVKEAGFYVLRNTTMPSILLETAFISNPYEEARLQNPTYQKNVAAAIFHGIFNYYKNPLPKA